MSVACARLLGVERILKVDHHDYRLQFAAAIWGVETINVDQFDDPAQAIVDVTGGRGVDATVEATVEAVGFEAEGSPIESLMTDLKLGGASGKALRQCIAATRRGGTVSVPGVYAGWIHGFLFGDAFDKGLTFRMGQTHVAKYMPELLAHIVEGRLSPEAIVSHVLPLDEAARGYAMFNDKLDACRKVVLTTAASRH